MTELLLNEDIYRRVILELVPGARKFLWIVTADIKDFSLSRAERELIARALKETGWQKTQAASLLGITRATLYAKVKQYNIEKEGESLPDCDSSRSVAVATL